MTTPVDDYRDGGPIPFTLPNQQADGGRKWLYPRATRGRFTRWRWVVAGVLLAGLFAGPFVWVNGHPLFLFNVLERRFILFGVPFWPQDFYLVAIGLITFIVFIALFTVVYGRVWCGWACPQTIFMEMVFRPIESLIEGDFRAKQRLDAGPWTGQKIGRKALKHGVFLLISFAISNTFLAYLIGRDQLWTIVTDNPANHLGGLLALLAFTGVFYGVFAYLREIVCTTICPYGRLQSVLLDKNSLVVAYDYVRGEPRGKAPRPPKGETTPLAYSPFGGRGACVDCALCVQVCPTGIDIRNGTQMECINCTACMDACDEVMTKINRPTGLIRMDSLVGIETGQPFRFTTRIRAYTAVLVGLLALLGYLLISRPALDATLLRAPGQLSAPEAGGRVSNLYALEIINKTYRPMPVRLRVSHPGATVRFVQPLTEVQPGELSKTMLFISLPQNTLTQSSTPLTVEILSGNEVVDRVKTGFYF